MGDRIKVIMDCDPGIDDGIALAYAAAHQDELELLAITTFAGNINNFNVIYLLSNGAPTPVGKTAGKTDLLVTWLYKLTVDNQYYNLGAVIGIMTFIVLAVVSLVTYHNTASYKDEEGFQ